MSFQVLNGDKVFFTCESPEAEPELEELLSMQAAGYTFRRDGQPWEPVPRAAKAKKAAAKTQRRSRKSAAETQQVSLFEGW